MNNNFTNNNTKTIAVQTKSLIKLQATNFRKPFLALITIGILTMRTSVQKFRINSNITLKMFLNQVSYCFNK